MPSNNNQVVLVFDLENKQESYARCLGAIEYFETQILYGNKAIYKFFRFAKKLSPAVEFYVNKKVKGPNDKMEGFNDVYARIPLPQEQEYKYLSEAVEIWRKQEKEKEGQKPHFHIRIRFDHDDNNGYQNIENLQFLAMLLQKVYITCYCHNQEDIQPQEDIKPDYCEADELQQRLSVYLVPYWDKGDLFPERFEPLKLPFAHWEDKNLDSELFSLASQYLRLITKQHNGVVYSYNDGKITAVDFKTNRNAESFFPLLYLANADNYKEEESINNYRLLFENAGMVNAKEIVKWFGYSYKVDENKPQPFNLANAKKRVFPD